MPTITIPLCSGERVHNLDDLEFDGTYDVVTVGEGAFRGTFECWADDETVVFTRTRSGGEVRVKVVSSTSTFFTVPDPARDQVEVYVTDFEPEDLDDPEQQADLEFEGSEEDVTDD